MGQLIVIEGVDGAGKRTLTDGLIAELRRRGRSVTRAAFPRYTADVHAELVGEALRGRHGDLASSVYGMAVLYALDRRDAAADLRAELAEHDVVLVDRYVASNAAYGAARLFEDVGGDLVEWVHELEVERFDVPRPDMQILLRVPVGVAEERAQRRERTEPARDRDRFETDSSLQQRCAEVYEGLAAKQWWSPWLVVDGDQPIDFEALVTRLGQ